MPRTKQFDVEGAKEKAKALFWAKGYEATSMDDLLRCMGIGRGSFYATFGSKQEVYAAVLQRYDQQNRRDVLRGLREAHPPRDAILKLFGAVRDEASAAEGTRGCFLANATLELAASDRTVARIVREAFAETEAFFLAMLRAGQRAGEVRRDLDPKVTARTLLGLILGMRVLARSGAGRPALEAITTHISGLL